MFDRYPPKSVVVGVDGSQAAIRAARWAVDEVAGTDFPLRLLYVTKPNPTASRGEAAARGAAEEVVHEAYSAIDEMGKPLKVETEVIHGRPVPALIAASRSTRLLCVGDTGAAQHPDGWLGSTAKQLAPAKRQRRTRPGYNEQRAESTNTETSAEPLPAERKSSR